MVLQEYDGVESVSLAAYEAQAARTTRYIKYLVLGWFLSLLVVCSAFVIAMSYTEEEITETTTTSEIAQNTGDNGSNSYIGGDYYGNANDKISDENNND